jgi:hypothetical protein
VADARVVAGVVLAAAALVQAAFSASVPREWRPDRSIGPPPDARVAAVASLGETRGAAYGLALVLQGFDTQAGEQQRLRELDHDATAAWLARIGTLAPATGYDAYLATRIYADVMPAPVLRRVLEHVHDRFLESPDANWSSLVHAVWIAAHPLADRPLAARFARALRERAGPAVPQWARELQGLVAADLDELESARALVGALHSSGATGDAREQQRLAERLRALERRHPPDERPRVPARP